jgi:hypothetical protein
LGVALALYSPEGGKWIHGGPAVLDRTLGGRWIHPLAEMRHLPVRDTRRFGAARPGQRPIECGGGHCGVDVGGQRGSIVHAAASGKVVTTAFEPRGRAGRYIAIEHSGGVKSFYMHLDDLRPDLEVGMTVAAGEAIGTLGASGIVRSKPHLHFAVSRDSIFVDPEPLLHRAVVLPDPAPLLAGTAPAPSAMKDEPASQPRSTGSATVYSDASGHFRFEGVPAGRYKVVARRTGWAPGTSDLFAVQGERSPGDVALRLTDGIAIAGRISGPQGPLPGARVTAWQGSGESEIAIATAIADAWGHYQLQHLPGGITLRVSAGGHAEGARHLENRAESSAAEDFALAALTERLAGKVSDESGFAVQSALVRIIQGPAGVGRIARSDEYGRFAIEGVARGKYRLQIISDAHARAVMSAHSDREVQARLAPASSLQLQVIDGHTLRPIAGALVALEGAGCPRAKMRTSASGSAHFGLLRSGTCRLALNSPGYVQISTAARIPVGSAETLRVEMRRGARLAGVLRDADGNRVAGAKVSAGNAHGTTDGDGRFSLEDVPTGKVVLRGEFAGHAALQAMNLETGDEYVTLELRLRDDQGLSTESGAEPSSDDEPDEEPADGQELDDDDNEY